jgi:hypothetical protein
LLVPKDPALIDTEQFDERLHNLAVLVAVRYESVVTAGPPHDPDIISGH